MKIRMTRSYSVWESYESIEINPEDYPELKGMSEEEVLAYINDNAYDFVVKDNSEENIVDEIMFGRYPLKDNQSNDEITFYLD